MRQIILDTETTGLDPKLGHRVIEVAAVEIIDRRPTGQHFHRYVNPGRASEEGALQVHGLTEEFLRDKPKFCDIAKEFLEFVAGAELIIHNAAFDCAFLDAELGLLDLKPINGHCAQILDTLKMARELHPGKKNNLNSLCLMIDAAPTPEAQAETRRATGELKLLVIVATAEELADHELQLAEIDRASRGACLWKKLAVA